MPSLTDKVCLVGHPFAPIGMGEHVRCTYRALRSVAVKPTIVDIYKLQSPDSEDLDEFSNSCRDAAAPINVFHINADEVDQAMAHLSYNAPWKGYKIIYPAWELSRYPKEWALRLDQFDEIWAPSRFIKASLESECKRSVYYMPLACEVVLSSFLSRRYFGIPETDYVFLYFFDVRSYSERKNPEAVIKAFRQLLVHRPYAKSRLVLKINGSDIAQNAMKALEDNLDDIATQVTVITNVMTDNEVKNLIRCCDCFVSLHRSEGYGRGMAEAMFLSKPVIATAYSGNMDFMSDDTALLVPYKLVPVERDSYPHWQNQSWAEPDCEVASRYMASLLDNPEAGRELGNRAHRRIRLGSSYRAIGLRYLERIETLLVHT